ncbi:D-hexose-6-phosphate mutarotase [Corynebacterium pelargi]|uniref:Glucose-6-phosphate 1-epimerase n=1 Tax=Corynebacterium pelargi TaxID=1471400 RepID=A0A410WBA1_9CORY|nr:D-hexose-6-phosphate mutarotase [Corynebacterium pelargi]QAU53248.1 Putative glucose-6-phosphate 1-epimerase [Corynebacterium pelargi]GGG73778.1 D-hexose-6-phosphate mutarotase [Corynebacterium pelargi]
MSNDNVETPSVLAHAGMRISPAGGHITSATTGHGELFYLSGKSRFGVGESIRGGVPVIAPWFGGLLAKSPSHGWARRELWNVEQKPQGFVAKLRHDDVCLELKARIEDEELTITLEAINRGSCPTTAQFALHPYFAVGDIESTVLRGLGGTRALDQLSGQECSLPKELRIQGQVDLIAHESRRVVIDDGVRRIVVSPIGADATVVWNPGEEKASTMDDVGAGEWRKFLCVEPALLGENLKGVRLRSGDAVTVGMRIHVEE